MEKTRILKRRVPAPIGPPPPPPPLRTSDPDEMLAMYLVARARQAAVALCASLSDERSSRVRGHVNRLLALDAASRHALLARTFGDAEDATDRAVRALSALPAGLRRAAHSQLPPHVRERVSAPTAAAGDQSAHRAWGRRPVAEALRR